MTASCSIKDKIEQMPDFGGHLLFIIFAAFVQMEEEHYADQEENYDFNMQLTLEEHFSNLAKNGDGIKQLHNLWELLRADLASRLQTSKSVFIHYSLHDSTHSRTVISAIEMFLGEERIKRLSATDTFMLLCCSYAHDYGMVLAIDKVYNLLNSWELKTYVWKEYENSGSEVCYE